MLLRMFVLLYDTEVVEEEAFLKWKEDVSEKHPGKGKALFQVGSALFSFLGIFQSLVNYSVSSVFRLSSSLTDITPVFTCVGERMADVVGDRGRGGYRLGS